MIKTNREQLADVAAVVKEKHPYDNPEVSLSILHLPYPCAPQLPAHTG